MSNAELKLHDVSKTWQQELADLLSTPEQLFQFLELDPALMSQAYPGHELFPIRCTQAFAGRIQKGDIHDPLLKQIMPSPRETDKVAGFVHDPLMEKSSNPVKGMLHKYKSRVLFIAATQCAINCRYCFRRHFPYQENQANRQQWLESLAYIHNDRAINEVILSGGDPLVLADKQLHWLIQEIEKIPHVTRLRIHSRLPIVLPSRMTEALGSMLASSRLNSVMVIHCNHAQEIDSEVADAIMRLRAMGVTVLNQAVLLRDVNDKLEDQVNLSERLFEVGALPYYLYLLDRVEGAAHFDVPESEAVALYQELLTELPGYLVPKLMREIPGQGSKTPVVIETPEAIHFLDDK